MCVWFPFSDAAPRLLQENQKYLSQLTSLMQEAADEQAKSIVVSSLVLYLRRFSCSEYCKTQTAFKSAKKIYKYLNIYSIFSTQTLKLIYFASRFLMC